MASIWSLGSLFRAYGLDRGYKAMVCVFAEASLIPSAATVYNFVRYVLDEGWDEDWKLDTPYFHKSVEPGLPAFHHLISGEGCWWILCGCVPGMAIGHCHHCLF